MSEIKKLLKEKSRALSGGKYKEAAEVCNAIGNELVNQESYEEALEQHVEELQYCEISGDQLGIAVANRKIGECYTHLNSFKKALQYIRKYYDICVSLNSVLEKQRAYATFGRTYYLKYQHEIACANFNSPTVTLDRAEHAYCKALELLPKLASEIKPIELAEMRCRLCLNWGLISENRGKYEISCKRIKEALDIASKYRLLEDIQRCGLALGTVYQKIGEFYAADQAYEMALSAAKKLQNKSMMCEILLSQGTNLISQENFNGAKKCLKVGYRLRTINVNDYEKIAKLFKVCIGLYRSDKKLNMTKDYQEKKMLLEKIADGLSSINCYKLAIQKYLLTLDCMLKADATESEKAPIYFSLAKTYFDDGNTLKALEYFEKEFNCNKDKPLEQIKTLWEIADVLEKEGNINKMEEIYLKSVSIAEKAGKEKTQHESLSKLYSFYKNIKRSDHAQEVKKKLDNIMFGCSSDDETDDDEATQNPFSDIDLSDLSDSDNNEEKTTSTRRRTKKLEAKINEKGETPLHEACINGNLNMVKRLIENGHSVNVRDFAGWTPLHEACNYGFYEIAEYLLEKEANINDPGGPKCGGITALHDAASCGNFDVMQLLIDRGASVTVVDENKETPLHALLQWKHRVLNDMDVVTRRQCEIVENELRSKMQEAGMPFDGINNVATDAFLSDDSPYINSESDRVTEKRSRSPSLSPDIYSDSEDEVYSTPPCVINQDFDDANNAKAEYKSVMKNLRWSAAAVTPSISSHPHKEVSGPPLVNENEVVDEWLIKDTNELPKTKRKKRRVAKLNVRTSKCIDNYLISENISEGKDTSINNSVVNEDSNFSITSVGSTDKDMESNPMQTLKMESSKLSFCVRIHIANKLILVPVLDDTSSISWLSEEAAQRFQALDGSKPHLTLMKNGALLSASDCVKSIFSNNEEVMSSVEAWDEPSLEDRYVQICAKRSTVVSSSVRKRFQCLTMSSELNFSNCSIPPLHLSIIFSTLTFYKSLQHLNISGIPINDSNMKEFIYCIPSFSTLLTLNMSCCCLTSETFEKITNYLKNHMHENLLAALKSLDLSYNCFSSCSCFLPLLNLTSLVSLNLSSCGLDSSFLSNQTFCQKLESKRNLEIFNVSGNILGESGITNLLNHLPKLSLKRLNLKHTLDGDILLGSKLFIFFTDLFPFLTELILQGCYLTNADVNQISLVLAYCPQLQMCDLSANPSISSHSLCNFMNRADDNNISIIELNITGTCVWQHENFTTLTDLLRFKTLKHLCIDNCPENLTEILVESWKSKWGTRANCLNIGFWELSVI